MRRTVVSLLFVGLLSGCDFSDPSPKGPLLGPNSGAPGTLVGVVALSDGGVAKGLYVWTQQSCFLCDLPRIVGCTTDGLGSFRLENVEAGSYVIHFGAYRGYVTSAERSVVVRANEVTSVTLVLDRIVEE